MARLHDGPAEWIRLAAEGLRRIESARGLIEALRVTVPLPARKVYDCPFGGIPESRPEEQFGYFVEVPAPGHSSRTRPLSGATLALARLGPSHAGVVAEALRVENNERVRFQLAYALGEMGSADAAVLEALRSATLARLYGVRWIATESLRKLLFP